MTSADPEQEVWSNLTAASNYHTGGHGKGKLCWVKQWGGHSLWLMFRQDHFPPLPQTICIIKLQASSPKVLGFFCIVTKMQKISTRSPFFYLNMRVVTEEVLETKISNHIAVKIMTSLSITADLRCRNVYTTETTPPSGSKRKKELVSWKPWDALEVSLNRVTNYLSNDNRLDSQGRGGQELHQASFSFLTAAY